MKRALLALLVFSACAAKKPEPIPEPTLMGLCYLDGIPYDESACTEPVHGVPWHKELPVNVYISPNYPRPDVVRASMLLWNEWLGSTVFVEVSNLADSDMIVQYRPGNVFEPAGMMEHRVFDERPFVITTVWGTYSYNPMIVAHELGHALGLDHDPDQPESLMYPTADWKRPRVTDADIAALKKHLGLK